MSERKADTPEISPVMVERRAETVFESRKIALKWLKRPITALRREVPSKLTISSE